MYFLLPKSIYSCGCIMVRCCYCIITNNLSCALWLAKGGNSWSVQKIMSLYPAMISEFRKIGD